MAPEDTISTFILKRPQFPLESPFVKEDGRKGSYRSDKTKKWTDL
jgi:hypothetical protein